jgi:hypothetical protein
MPRSAPAAVTPDAGSADSPDIISARARAHGRVCIDVLVELLADPDPQARIAAAVALLDVGHGRPTQPFVLDGRDVHIAVHGIGEPHRPNGEDEGDSWTPFHERGG